MNNGVEKADTQTPESQATSATPEDLLKQPEERNGKNNLNNRDSYTPQEKVRSPVQQASFSGRRDSAETAGVTNKKKVSRANRRRSRSKTRKPRKRKYISSSSSSRSLISSSSSSYISESEISSSSSSSDSERKKRKKSKKKESKKDKTKKQKTKKKYEKSNHTRFEVIPGKSKNAWYLPESMLGYVIEHFEKYIKETDVQETILDDNPLPENMRGRKDIDNYLKKIILEAKKPRKLEQDRSLEKIQQKVLNIMGPLSKLRVGVDEDNCSGKSGRMSLEDLSIAIEQTVVLVGQAS